MISIGFIEKKQMIKDDSNEWITKVYIRKKKVIVEKAITCDSYAS